MNFLWNLKFMFSDVAVTVETSGAGKNLKMSKLSVPSTGKASTGGSSSSLAVPQPGGLFPLANSQQMASSGSATGKNSWIFLSNLTFISFPEVFLKFKIVWIGQFSNFAMTANVKYNSVLELTNLFKTGYHGVMWHCQGSRDLSTDSTMNNGLGDLFFKIFFWLSLNDELLSNDTECELR